MNEFVLALWAMAASHHQWEMPPKEPVAIVQPLESHGAARELSAGERRELRTAVERMARCATGRLRSDADAGWYIPEQKPTKSCGALAAENGGSEH
jgi:hypothetical protein